MSAPFSPPDSLDHIALALAGMIGLFDPAAIRPAFWAQQPLGPLLALQKCNFRPSPGIRIVEETNVLLTQEETMNTEATSPHLYPCIITTTVSPEGKVISSAPADRKPDTAPLTGPGEILFILDPDVPTIEAKIGGTGYLDQFTKADMTGPVMKGFDSAGRKFFVLCASVNGRRPRVVCLFERYQNRHNLWVLQDLGAVGCGAVDAVQAAVLHDLICNGSAVYMYEDYRGRTVEHYQLEDPKTVVEDEF